MNGRLNGWKEIAAYLGRTVRTAQRWEKELELPVRRVQAKTGEIIYAETEEIEQWLKSRSTGGAPPAETPPESQSGSPRFWLVAVPGILVLAALAIVIPRMLRKAAPFYSQVQENRLIVFDRDHNVLWEKNFPERLWDNAYTEPLFPDHPPVRIEDLDGDGRKEVLFLLLTIGTSKNQPRFQCYNPDSTLRFEVDATSRPVRFGDREYGYPMQPRLFELARESRGLSIWLARIHQPEFPSVVQKIDTQGKVLGEYWSAGHISALRESVYQGRRVMLVGAVTNDHEGGAASLAVLDYEHPSGSAPALNDKYKCRNCPPGQPLAYFVFPRLEIASASSSQSVTSSIRLQPGGAFTVMVEEGHTHMPDGLDVNYPAFYTFSQSLEPLTAELASGFMDHIRMAERAGLLNRHVTRPPERDLFPVLQWDGSKFVERRPAK